MANRRERVVHAYELGRPFPGPDRSLEWWEEEPTLTRMERIHGQLPTHGASGVGNVKKEKTPTWAVVTLLLLGVLIVCLATVLYMDLSRGKLLSIWPENTTSTTSAPKDMTAVSVDDVKDKLVAKGFDVDYLKPLTDLRLLAFETVATEIDKKPARIMTFKDHKTALKWIEGSDILTISKDTWIVTTNNELLAQRMAKALGANLHG